MDRVALLTVALLACSTHSTATRPHRPSATSAAQPVFVPVLRPPEALAGIGMQQGHKLVQASSPIQYPRSYWVGSQLWTTYSTVAQLAMEVHLIRSDPEQRAVLFREVLTPVDRTLSAYGSLAVSPDRVLLAYDDDRNQERWSFIANFTRPAPSAAPAPLVRSIDIGLFAFSTSSSVVWSPTLQQWGGIAGNDRWAWFAALRPDGMCEGGAARPDTITYTRGCGESLLWNGRTWAALVRDRRTHALSVLEFDGRSPFRLMPLGLQNAPAFDASIAFDAGRYAVGWADERGVHVSIARDEQTHTPVVTLANSAARAGNPVVAFDGQHRLIVLWTETPTTSVIKRAFIDPRGAVTATEVFASHPTQHAWWPHMSPRESNAQPIAYTWQVGQSEAHVWIDRAPGQ
jgi:hypothetical protein